MASSEGNSMRYSEDPTPPGYYATAVPLIQAVPLVINSEAGIKENEGPLLHFRSDIGSLIVG